MKEIVLKTDITCGHCAQSIMQALKKVKGVKGSEANVPEKTVSVRYDENKITVAAIIAAIVDAGYSAFLE